VTSQHFIYLLANSKNTVSKDRYPVLKYQILRNRLVQYQQDTHALPDELPELWAWPEKAII